jgi:hypothetical protein
MRHQTNVHRRLAVTALLTTTGPLATASLFTRKTAIKKGHPKAAFKN